MIKAEHLTKKYGSFVAVDDLSLMVENELFVFLGVNGAGKTTTIKMMNGLLRPGRGKVWIHGIDIQENPVKAKRITGLVPEEPYLYEKLKTHEFIRFLADIYKIPPTLAKRRMDQLFDIFELTEHADALIDELSHGTRRKVALVGALIHDPEVLFLDEPTIGLDPESVRTFKTLLDGLIKQGKTIFMSTHILELAEKMCHRIGIIHQGKLHTVATLEQLKTESGYNNLEDIFLNIIGSRNDSSLQSFLQGNAGT